MRRAWVRSVCTHQFGPTALKICSVPVETELLSTVAVLTVPGNTSINVLPDTPLRLQLASEAAPGTTGVP